MAKKFLSGSAILEVPLAFEDVDMSEEWGGWVRIREMTGPELFEWQKLNEGAEPLDGIVRLIIMTACNDNDDMIFTHDNFEELRTVGMQAILKVQDVALRINKLTDKDIKEVQGN